MKAKRIMSILLMYVMSYVRLSLNAVLDKVEEGKRSRRRRW